MIKEQLKIKKMMDLKKAKKEIMSVVNKHRLVDDREAELIRAGYNVVTASMGSGGVGQVKELKDCFRIQIGYGVSQHNYAKCVEIPKKEVLI